MIQWFFIALGLFSGVANAADVQTYLLRNHPQIGVYETLEVSSEKSQVLGLITQIVRRVVQRGSPPSAGLLKIEGDPGDFHFSLIEPDLNFVIPRYDRREWGADFQKELRHLARLYLNDSIYVRMVSLDGRQLGAIRFIHRPYRQRRWPGGVEVLNIDDALYGPTQGYRKADALTPPGSLPLPPEALPEAHHLGIVLPMRYLHVPLFGPNGQIVAFMDDALETEVGNFAVDETLPAAIRLQVRTELWIQFMRMAFGNHSWRRSLMGQAFHAYADESSLKLYLPLGFELLREYVLDGKRVRYSQLDEVPPIVKDGVNWWPIVFYPEKILEFNEKLSTQVFRRIQPQGLKERRQEGVEAEDFLSDRLSGLPNILENLAHEDDRVAEAAGMTVLEIFRAVHLYGEAMTTACPNQDYGSDFENDPMMFGYRTYCDMIGPWIHMSDLLREKVLPRLNALLEDFSNPKVRRRVLDIVARLKESGHLERYQLAPHLGFGDEVKSHGLSQLLRLLLEVEKAPRLRFGIPEPVKSDLNLAVSRLVHSITTQEFSAIVLSGESAIVSFALLKKAWQTLEIKGHLPPVYWIEPGSNTDLKQESHARNNERAREFFKNVLPGLSGDRAKKILVLDDFANTGNKYVRFKDFFHHGGFTNVHFEFIAAHPDSIAQRPGVGSFESAALVEHFQKISQLLTTDRESALSQVGALAKALEADLQPCGALLIAN